MWLFWETLTTFSKGIIRLRCFWRSAKTWLKSNQTCGFVTIINSVSRAMCNTLEHLGCLHSLQHTTALFFFFPLFIWLIYTQAPPLCESGWLWTTPGLIAASSHLRGQICLHSLLCTPSLKMPDLCKPELWTLVPVSCWLFPHCLILLSLFPGLDFGFSLVILSAHSAFRLDFGFAFVWTALSGVTSSSVSKLIRDSQATTTLS